LLNTFRSLYIKEHFFPTIDWKNSSPLLNIKQNFKKENPLSLISVLSVLSSLMSLIYNFFRVHGSLDDTSATSLGIELCIKDKFLGAFRKCFA